MLEMPVMMALSFAVVSTGAGIACGQLNTALLLWCSEQKISGAEGAKDKERTFRHSIYVIRALGTECLKMSHHISHMKRVGEGQYKRCDA